MITDDNMSAIEWTQKQIKEAFANITPPKKTCKVKGRIVKRKRHLEDDPHLQSAIDAWRMKE